MTREGEDGSPEDTGVGKRKKKELKLIGQVIYKSGPLRIQKSDEWGNWVVLKGEKTKTFEDT